MTTTTRRRIRDDFDGAWKNMLSERRFEAFIAFFKPDWHAEIDWTRGVVFLEQELRAITRKSKRGGRSVDKLARVWLLDGTERWVLVHVEVQSQEDAEFPSRMFQYRARAHDLFDERPIACLAILGDPSPRWRPTMYECSFWGTEIGIRFPTIKLLDYLPRMDELHQDRNPFARFVVAHLKTLATQGDYESRMEWKLRIIQGLYDMDVPEEEIGRLYHDFDWLLALPEPLARRFHGTMTKFEEDREMPHLSTAERVGRRIGRKEGRNEGRKEGRKEGREEGRREMLKGLMEFKFGPLSDQCSAAVDNLSPGEIERISREILSAQSLEDLQLPAAEEE